MNRSFGSSGLSLLPETLTPINAVREPGAMVT